MKITILSAAARRGFFLIILTLLVNQLWAQKPVFTRQDTLRGSITSERAWWDLTHYHLDIQVNPGKKTIQGVNTISYKVLQPNKTMQIDLQPPLNIEKVEQNGKPLSFKRDGNAYFVTLTEPQTTGALHKILVFYSGTPQVSKNPP